MANHLKSLLNHNIKPSSCLRKYLFALHNSNNLDINVLKEIDEISLFSVREGVRAFYVLSKESGINNQLKENVMNAFNLAYNSPFEIELRRIIKLY